MERNTQTKLASLGHKLDDLQAELQNSRAEADVINANDIGNFQAYQDAEVLIN